jgi:hypothetical protein
MTRRKRDPVNPTKPMPRKKTNKKRRNGRSIFGSGGMRSTGLGSKGGLSGVIAAVMDSKLGDMIKAIINAPDGTHVEEDVETSFQTEWKEEVRSSATGAMINAQSQLKSEGKVSLQKKGNRLLQIFFPPGSSDGVG